MRERRWLHIEASCCQESQRGKEIRQKGERTKEREKEASTDEIKPDRRLLAGGNDEFLPRNEEESTKMEEEAQFRGIDPGGRREKAPLGLGKFGGNKN